jgi:peroxiredoxin
VSADAAAAGEALPVGTPAPEFSLATEDGGRFTHEDLRGHTTVLVFYPFAFSPVCTDQLQVYEEVLGEFERRGARLFAVSTDATWSQKAFREQLGVSIPQLSDFEPKGAASRALGAYFEPAGMTNRAIVIFGPDATVRWSHVAANPAELPGANLILDALDAA